MSKQLFFPDISYLQDGKSFHTQSLEMTLDLPLSRSARDIIIRLNELFLRQVEIDGTENSTLRHAPMIPRGYFKVKVNFFIVEIDRMENYIQVCTHDPESNGLLTLPLAVL